MNQVRVKIEINSDDPQGVAYEIAATQRDETIFDALSSALAYCVGRTAEHLECSPGVYVLMADVIESLAVADAQGCMKDDTAMRAKEGQLRQIASDLVQKELAHVTEDAPAATA